MVEQPVVDLERLHSWKAALERKLAELDARVRPLLAEVEKTRQQLQLVDRLLGLESRGGGGRLVSVTSPTSPGDFNGSVTEALASILLEAGHPLHISQVKERFLSLGLTIPGRGNESNLLSYIVRDPRFVRVSKGTYTLEAGAALGPASTPVKRASKGRKKRR